MSAHISAGVDEIGWKMKAAIALIIESEVITAQEQLQLLVNILVLINTYWNKKLS